jgi:DNA repair exonuclease SbcCD nuclease subunit
MRFLHTADVHLHPHHPERFNSLRRLGSLAQEQACDAVVIAGDMFDSNAAAETYRSEVRGVFESWELPVLIVPGNHDEAAFPPSVTYGRNVRVLHASSKPIEIADVRFVGLPFCRGQAASPLLDQIPPSDSPTVLIAHASFFLESHAYIFRRLEESGEGNEFALFRDDLAGRDFAYVALGHWHQPTQVAVEDVSSVAYPGTPCPIARDETGKRQTWLVTLTESAESVERLLMQQTPYYLSPRWLLAPGREEATVEAIETHLLEHADPLAMITLVVEGYIGVDEVSFRKQLEELANAYTNRYREAPQLDFHATSSGLLHHPAVERFLQELEDVDWSDLAGQFEAGILYQQAEKLLAESEALRTDVLGCALAAFRHVLGDR